jgi:uncharacterized FAD-dependent dehydrogenase
MDENDFTRRFPFCKSDLSTANMMETITVQKQGKSPKIVIAGFGPAGMFAGLILAENDYKPLILERGDSMSERVEAVKCFWNSGILDTNTNVQFGEGGAGTFSDGKLTTRINDNRVRYVLETFVKYGAPPEILRSAKPHIGTDKLQEVVQNIRERIIALGGEVRFNSTVTDIEVRNSRIRSVKVNNAYTETSDALILAIGHSAGDTFEMLKNRGALMSAKPFSVGVRIEHKQSDLNNALYGTVIERYKDLPVGEYQLSKRIKTPDGDRAVYTFCMCPGGIVVPAQSEENTIVINGMSYHARSNENANAALCVSVNPSDYVSEYGNSPLAGLAFTRAIERKAYELTGGYAAPASTVQGFLNGAPTLSGASVTPSYALGVAECDFRKLFPPFVTDMLAAGIYDFSKKLRVYGDGGAVMTAPETRTSSPVRIERQENLQAVGITGLYPGGEGAGYAGGIVSAAVDGIKCAQMLALEYAEEKGHI